MCGASHLQYIRVHYLGGITVSNIKKFLNQSHTQILDQIPWSRNSDSWIHHKETNKNHGNSPFAGFNSSFNQQRQTSNQQW